MVPLFLSSLIGTTCTYLVAFFFLVYLIPHVFVSIFYKTKNLKKSYNASWGLVTGGSSGELLRQLCLCKVVLSFGHAETCIRLIVIIM